VKTIWETLSGDTLQLQVDHRPLGVVFEKRAPTTVSKVTDVDLEDNGVQPGCKLVEIAGTRLQGMAHNAAKQMIEKAIEHLPNKPATHRARQQVGAGAATVPVGDLLQWRQQGGSGAGAHMRGLSHTPSPSPQSRHEAAVPINEPLVPLRAQVPLSPLIARE
jgi:hypothetical protein